MKTIQYKVGGMHCNSCVSLITMELADVVGITGISIDLKTGIGSATLTEATLGEADILAAIERAGYSATIVKS